MRVPSNTYKNVPDHAGGAAYVAEGIENRTNAHERNDSMSTINAAVNATSDVEWIVLDDHDLNYRTVPGLFGCGDVAITVEARRDDRGTTLFVAIRTDQESMLDVQKIDNLIAALAGARQDLLRIEGELR